VNNQSMAYGATVPPLTGTLSGVVAGDGITASYATTGTSSSPAGSYPITATLNDPNSKLGNYTVSNTPGTLTIGKTATTVTWATPAAITYGAALSAVQLNATSSVAGTITYTPAAGSVLTAGLQALNATFTPTDAADYSTATATVSITVNQAMPTVMWAMPAPISFGTPLSGTQLNATANVPGTFAYSPSTGTVLPVGSNTVSVTFTPTDTVDYTTSTAQVSITVNPGPPVLSSLLPPIATAAGAAFTLTVNGSGFASGATVYWGSSSLATNLVNAAQLTAQVPASDITSAGITSVTAQNPGLGGGTSNALQFEVDSASGSSPQFSTVTATVAPGSPASYTVSLSGSATNISVQCLNLPVGATCSYSATSGAVTISTSATTPAGTYQITVVFTETLPGAASGLIFLPILLLPLMATRRKWARQRIWSTALLAIAIAAVASTIGCGGGTSGGGGNPPPQTHTVTSSGTVTLIVQ